MTIRPARTAKVICPAKRTALLMSIAAIYLGAAASANANVIDLSYTTTTSGTSGPGTSTTLTVPGSHTYGNTLGALTTPVYTIPTGPNAGQSFEFYDDYVFTISGASANSITSSINLGSFLGLDNFQVRLYELAGNTPLPAFGTPASDTLIQVWSTQINYSPGMSGLIAVISDHTLNAGSYVLEVRGNVSGEFGGSYSGVMNLAPVPVPAAAWLLLSGIGALGSAVRRRTASPMVRAS